jgi:hypothetical protein
MISEPMTTKRHRPRGQAEARGADRTTFRPGDYGRVTRPDGSEQWWIRSPSGGWTALPHQRVVENEDGTITLLYLS